MALKRILLSAVVSAAVFLSMSIAIAADPPADAEFDGMDANHDGGINAEEHAQATARMFTTMDANADGKVTAKEMTAAHKKITGKKAKSGDMSSQDKIKVIDSDGDGELTAAEHEAGAVQMFNAMDVVGDGRVSRAEMNSARLKMMGPQEKQ